MMQFQRQTAKGTKKDADASIEKAILKSIKNKHKHFKGEWKGVLEYLSAQGQQHLRGR